MREGSGPEYCVRCGRGVGVLRDADADGWAGIEALEVVAVILLGLWREIPKLVPNGR